MFVSELHATAPIGSDIWILDEPLAWEANGERIVVPAKFITDLASVPRIVQNIVPVNRAHRHAAVLHDYLFVIQDRSREAADKLFLEAMEAVGVGWLMRWTMYLAVRAGGWLPWRRNAEQLSRDPIPFLASHGLKPAECRVCPPAEIDAVDV